MQREVRLSEDVVEDLHQMLWMELLKVKRSYHNPRGVNCVCTSKLNRWLRSKRPNNPIEITNMEEGTHFPMRVVTNGYHGIRDSIDLQKIVRLLPILPSSERAVVELLYGLSGAEAIHPLRVSQRLGHSSGWVESRRTRAIARIREKLRIAEVI